MLSKYKSRVYVDICSLHLTTLSALAIANTAVMLPVYGSEPRLNALLAGIANDPAVYDVDSLTRLHSSLPIELDMVFWAKSCIFKRK